jgi:hypothetical protein
MTHSANLSVKADQAHSSCGPVVTVERQRFDAPHRQRKGAARLPGLGVAPARAERYTMIDGGTGRIRGWTPSKINVIPGERAKFLGAPSALRDSG